MMKLFITTILCLVSFFGISQIDVNATLGIPRVTDANGNGIDDEIANETAQNIGNVVYNTTDNLIYRYDGTNWIATENTDNQNIDVLTLSSTNELTVGIENGTDRTVNLGSLTDHDWYQANTTLPATDINQSIFTQGDIGVGTNNPQRAIHLAGNNSIMRISRSVNTAAMIFDRYSGAINNTLKSFQMGVNASGPGVGNFFIADYNENVGGGNFTEIITFTDGFDPIRFDQYATGSPASFEDNSPPDLLGVNATGQVVKVDNIAPRIFYPPSIAIPAETTGAQTPIDLYQQYFNQYGVAIPTRSTGAPATIPVYQRDQLYYYVTFADPDVFGTPSTITIDVNGMMNYSVVNLPADFNTIINVVFVVK